eukprot:359078-Chlamydomonas_euryale.AAC.1
MSAWLQRELFPELFATQPRPFPVELQGGIITSTITWISRRNYGGASKGGACGGGVRAVEAPLRLVGLGVCWGCFGLLWFVGVDHPAAAASCSQFSHAER